MKISSKSIVFFLLLLTTSIVCIGISIIVSIGLTGLPESFSHLIIYICITAITAFALFRKKDDFTLYGIYTTLVLSWLILFLPKAINSSINFTLTIIPFFISFVLAMFSGYIYYKKRTMTIPILIGAFPLIFTLGLNSIWINKITYGSFSGEVEFTKVPDFSFVDKNDKVISKESIEGNVVILDFWFIGCRPCWAKFPKLQEIYEKYQSNERILIYAVNRPMKNDKPNQLYTSIKKKNYTFPVVRGSQELMDTFEITYYPTVIIIDPEGNLVYRGGIEKAENVIEDLLKKEL